MGLFSANCEQCSNPILPTFNTSEINDWMSLGVAVAKNGHVTLGRYDGYGRLEDLDGVVHDAGVGGWTADKSGPAVWHYACWQIAGSPTEWRGESASSPDQGHFFEEGTYDIPEPK